VADDIDGHVTSTMVSFHSKTPSKLQFSQYKVGLDWPVFDSPLEIKATGWPSFIITTVSLGPKSFEWCFWEISPLANRLSASV
jgi:hypothetical protein